MTSLLGPDDRDPGDCPYVWGLGYNPCKYHDLPVHRCFIQAGHEGRCLCMCRAIPTPLTPRAQRFRWTGNLNDSPTRVARLIRRARRDALRDAATASVQRS